MANLVYKGLKDNLPEAGTRNATSFYLVTDTRELYFGPDLYTEAVRFFNTTKPTNPAQGVLYVDLDAGAGYAWDGSKWNDVFKSATSIKADLIGISDDTADEDTIYGAKAYADDAVDDAKEELIGEDTDTKDDDTIKGAKKYADQVKSDVIGNDSDASSAVTVYGARALAAEKVASVTAQEKKGINVDNTDTKNPKIGLALQASDNDLKLNEQGELYYKAADAEEYTIVAQGTAEEGFAATYYLSKGGVQAGAKINIPKDIFVQDISAVQTAESDIPNTDIKTGDKYVVFTVDTTAAGTKKLYLKLTDLVDSYTADGKGITLSSSNVFSLQIDSDNANGLEVGDSGLKLGVATDTVAGAMSAADHVKLTAAYEAITVGSF